MFLSAAGEQCLVGLKGKIMQAYLDVWAVGSDTLKQHVVDVRRVLERTRDANIRLKLAKGTFGKTEVELLCHKVRFGEVRPNVLCTAMDETSVDIMGRMFCCDFLRKSRL
jgi:hypothetical protein